MATLSDFQPVHERFTVDPAVMERNAKAAGTQVNWRTTHVGMTAGARQSSPFGRDDASLVDARERRSQRLHKALDRLIDGPEPAESDDNEEPQEQYEDEPSLSELQSAVDAFLITPEPKPEVTVKAGASLALDSSDAGVLSRYVKPEDRIEYAKWSLECNLLNCQRDSSTGNERKSLEAYLVQMPKGSCVRDCDPKILLPLIRKLEANSNLIPAN